ncbi:MAG: hypothetical protein H6737_28015 [Alphaproteobacteria bacterium]|nr:hypothetical protein [Alphaproteobacteria bacterium]
MALDELAAPEPDYAAINAYIDAHEQWSDGVKPHYGRLQDRRCGYCEMRLTDYGDVEHYRPKNAIFGLKAPGMERDDVNNVSGRAFHRYPEKHAWNSGYWWLAYSWDNYLLACGRCNQNWKSALFPIKGAHRSRRLPGHEASETPWLLDPFGEEDPVDHLRFDDLGQVEGLTRHGRETILVCGLDRESVRRSREPKAIDTYSQLKKLARRAPIEDVLPDIERWGRREGSHHPGMVRCIFVQQTGMPWSELEALVATL